MWSCWRKKNEVFQSAVACLGCRDGAPQVRTAENSSLWFPTARHVNETWTLFYSWIQALSSFVRVCFLILNEIDMLCFIRVASTIFNLGGGVAFWVFSFFFEKKVILAWFSADISSLLSLEWSRWRTRVAIKFKCDSGWGQCICFTARRSGSSLPLGSLHVLSRYSRFLSHSKCS